jgi:glycerol-3-phosphate dehydrogenase
MRREPERLAKERFDVLVIGGGILGCAIARDAALRGLRVALVERGDFASGTSGRSSKLAHGGLRYLEHGHIMLVRESCRERERLLKLAPHLVKPLPFLLPHEPGDGWPPMWMLGIGLTMYDLFAGKTRVASHKMLGNPDIFAREPNLAGRRLAGGATYFDAQMDDSRLTLEAAIGAHEAGAVVVNHAAVTGFTRTSGGRITGAVVRDAINGRDHGVEARICINAAGPWGDGLLRLAGREGRPALMPTKGVHLVYGEPLVTHGLILRTKKEKRVFFILPWKGLTLIGTTDTNFSGDPGEVRADAGDIAYLLEAARDALPAARIDAAKVVTTFAGVRPLLSSGAKTPSAASREHAVREGPPGLVSVLGGKFTTFRAIAEQATDVVEARLGGPHQPCRTAELPLPGASAAPAPGASIGSEAAAAGAGRASLAPAILASLYGSRATQVLEAAKGVPDAHSPLCPHTARTRAEVAHAIINEMALTLADILDRRLGITLTAACRGTDCAKPAAEIAAPLLGWDSEETAKQIADYSRLSA